MQFLTFALCFALVNVFSGIQNNGLFCGILVVTGVLQCIIVQFGSKAFHVADDGLDAKMWGISLVCGVISLPVQQIINILYRSGGKIYKGYRSKNRKKRDAALSTRTADGPAKLHPE